MDMPKNPNAQPGDLTLEPYHFETNTGERIECEMGRLTVEESRGITNGRLIDLVFLRLKANTDRPSNPVVFLAGGPGDSGIFWAKYPQFLKAFQRIQQVADVILLDQRGCGKSEPCLSLPFPSDLPADALASRENMLKVLKAQGAQAVAKFKSSGIDTQAYNPEDSSDDLADLRDSLGVKKLNLIGYSYGSHLALTSIRRHESILDKVVLCGFEGPDDTLKMPSNVQRQLEKLARLWSKQGGQGDLLEAMGKVHENLEKWPVQVEVALPKSETRVTLTVGKFALQAIGSTWMGVSNRFHSLPRLYFSLLGGKTEELASAVERYLSGWTRSAVFYLTDGASLATSERLTKIKLEAPGCLLADAVNFPFPEINEVYQPKDLGVEFRSRVASDIPLLSITGSLDGNTPTEQALAQLPLFSNHRHHLIENAAHNDLLLPSVVHEAISEFIVTGDTKKLKSELPEPKFKPI